MDRMQSALTEARSALAKAQDDMTRYYNCQREPAPEYTPGDKIYLDGSDIQTSRPSKKLAVAVLPVVAATSGSVVSSISR
jgi:hypothetical protein